MSGFISAPMGIAGAIMNVPSFKIFWLFSINRAIGSAAASWFFNSHFLLLIGFLITGSYLKTDKCTFKYWFCKHSRFSNICTNNNIYGTKLGAKTVHNIDKKT